jgi:hypothetical protein
VLEKGKDSDLRIDHMFFRFLLTPNALLLTVFVVASRRRPLLQPQGPEGRSLSEAVRDWSAHASNCFFSNPLLLAPHALRYFKRLPRKKG